MSSPTDPALPPLGSQVVTACGGTINLEANTPGAHYRGGWVFFCLSTCLQEFEKDPQTSCLVDNPLLDEG